VTCDQVSTNAAATLPRWYSCAQEDPLLIPHHSHLRVRVATDSSNLPTFEELRTRFAWTPVQSTRGCPGRYVLAEPLAHLTPEQLLATPGPFPRTTSAAARDPMILVKLIGGGLLTYEHADGTFLHTLADEAGWERKLVQLGLSEPRCEPKTSS
jgi:hypothetical protein